MLDHALGTAANPARDERLRLPRREIEEINPPSAEEVERVLETVAARYRLPIMLLDATGLRLGELDGLSWGDVDSAHARIRVGRARSKSGRGRWVDVPIDLFSALDALVPREDRHPDRRVFQSITAPGIRSAIRKSCRALGMPVWSPHDLRHRRISLLVRAGVPITNVSAAVGHSSRVMALETYSHVIVGREIRRERWLQ